MHDERQLRFDYASAICCIRLWNELMKIVCLIGMHLNDLLSQKIEPPVAIEDALYVTGPIIVLWIAPLLEIVATGLLWELFQFGPTYVEMPILQDVNLDYDALAIEANDISAVLNIMPGVVLVQINSVNAEVIVEDVQ